ncbi:uncharacterized protein HMPREF1541_04859 [Cyphellophora europaea CBS 101466]|uniref:HAD hydrolase, family IA n=1 Tax=Cyphellophora europaea (strain CBS 101466) TaxID=1220924 RepID=W2RVV5_CYPE1|nr:uncharacterized protein HMPREF1541_04859 [Cyphellophora europaea CBS 101466]ETN40582.1 hypothetical protein HMPREF1541_04859 [Cyphellophora europaea CBS 101466]
MLFPANHDQLAAHLSTLITTTRPKNIPAALVKSPGLSSKLLLLSSNSRLSSSRTFCGLRFQSLTLFAMPLKVWIMFDLDNTLIDTEYLAFNCVAAVANRVLESKGITEKYTSDKLIGEPDFFGQAWKTMLNKLAEKHGFEITDQERKAWRQWEEEAVIAAVQKHGKPTKGVVEVLDKLTEEKKYRLAIVSSSSLPRMLACLDGVGLRKYFEDAHIFSASTSLPVPSAKPAPDVYEFALKTVGAAADQAVAVEDSLGGATASVGAGIDTIGYVGCMNMPMFQMQLEYDFPEKGAKATMTHWGQFFEILAKIEAGEE